MEYVEHRPDRAETVVFLHGSSVAGWMWDAQVHHLEDWHCVVPDLPGFGASATEDWHSVADTADQLAELIGQRAHGGRAHVVGMSLGGIVGLHLLARHPGLARSALFTGATVVGVNRATRLFSLVQFPLWRRRWFWAALGRAFRLPDEEARTRLIEGGLAIRKENAQRVVSEVYAGSNPPGLERADMPVLLLAGEKEAGVTARSATLLAARLPQAVARTVPGVHHTWNAEDPALFNRVLDAWLTGCDAEPSLLPLR